MHIWHPDLPRVVLPPRESRPVPLPSFVVEQMTPTPALAGLYWIESWRPSEDALLEAVFLTLGLIHETWVSAPIYNRVRRLVEWSADRRQQTREGWDQMLRADAEQFQREWAAFATERRLSPLDLDITLRTSPAVLAMRHLFRALGVGRHAETPDELPSRTRILLALGLALAAVERGASAHPPPEVDAPAAVLERWAGHIMARLAVVDPQAFELNPPTVGGGGSCSFDFPEEVDEHYGVDETPHTDISKEAGAFIREAAGLLDTLGIAGVRLVFGKIDSPAEKGSVGDLAHYLDGTMPCPVVVVDTQRMHHYVRQFRLLVREAVWITLAHECGHGWLDGQRVSSTQTDRVPLALEEKAVEAMAQLWWRTRNGPEALGELKRVLLAGVKKPEGGRRRRAGADNVS